MRYEMVNSNLSLKSMTKKCLKDVLFPNCSEKAGNVSGANTFYILYRDLFSGMHLNTSILQFFTRKTL